MAIIQPVELRETIDQPEVLLKAIQAAYKEWEKGLARLENLNNYYIGQHAITGRTMRDGLPNNKIVANHAKYISDMATGYLIGKPVKYSSKEVDLTNVDELYNTNDTGSIDADIAKDCSVFGRGYELDYQDEEGITRIAVLDPRTAFIVVDDTISGKPLYGVHIVRRTDLEGEESVLVTAYTEGKAHSFAGKAVSEAEHAESVDHYFSRVPLIEYQNNEEMQGDFEQVISLIDAYNQLTSDRLNAKEQDIDALLALYGVATPSTEDVKLMREERVIGMPDGSKAEWLVKQLSESDNETVRDALSEDIHKLSLTPDLTDENFAGNSSGVAMEYKVMGFDQLIAIKQRYFKAGLKQRLGNFLAVQKVKGNPDVDVSKVDIKFTRNMPVNELEIAQTVQALAGIVSKLTLYGMIPAIEGDPQDELEQLQEEQAQSIKAQEEVFGTPNMATPQNEPEDDEDDQQ